MKWAYTYSNGRLASVSKNGTLLASYGWDANGNRAGSAVDDQDRLVMQGDASWTYDVMGHLKTRTDSRGNWTFTYDALWNLLSATGPQNISYVVDPRGRRVGRKVNGALVQGFLYSGQLSIVAELDGSSQVVSRFVYGTRANVPDYMIKAGVKYKLICDHLGSVRLVVNTSTGAVVSRIEYNVWGEITASQNLSFQPFGFAGGLRDDATGLVRFGARDYDPHVGRWTAKDPIGFNGGGANLYGRVDTDPVDFIDQNGKYAMSFWAAIYFWNNYLDMRSANTIGSDKYFHCKANCQAVRSSPWGKSVSLLIGETREQTDELIKGDPKSACDADRVANAIGRENSFAPISCEEVCSELRPNGLNSKY